MTAATLTKTEAPPAKAPVAKKAKMEIVANLIPARVSVAQLTPERLKALAFISTYSAQDPQSTSPRKHGYQREPMEERFPGIARYYADNDNRFHIPPLVASVRVYDQKSRTRFNTLFNAGNINKIHQEFGKDVFSIVDGQHRIGGLFHAWNKFEDFNADVPVTMYYGLTYVQEAKLFDDINVNQRKLPKALIEATKVHMDTDGGSHAQTIRLIAMSLAEDGDSVWREQINMTGAPKAPEPVSYETLRRSTGDMFPVRVLERVEQRGFAPEKVAKKYWELVSKACTPAWLETPRFVENDEGETVEEAVKYRLKDTVGVASVSRLGQDIIITALDRTKTNDEFYEVMSELVSKLGAVNWEKSRNNPFTSTSAGFGGQRQTYSILYDICYLDRMPGEEIAPDER